ncbi:putative exonuclease GOR [Haemaphysalis longicornis]
MEKRIQEVNFNGRSQHLVHASDRRALRYAATAEDDFQLASGTVCSAAAWGVGPREGRSRLRFSADDLYRRLLSYALTPQQLFRCGYPRPWPANPSGVLCMQGDVVPSRLKKCCRCRASFIITEDGQYGASSSCSFHSGKRSDAGRFSCCGASASQPGCKSAYHHICSIGALDEWNTTSVGFVQTGRGHGVSGGVFALDCEMCFTIRGFEATRVSVVDWEGIAVYDTYVIPGRPVLDYNTAFSGVTAEHLRNVRTTLQDVQAELLQLFTASTVLAGHGLENDLRALRIFHDTVVDTALVFPHPRGLPFRPSLRSLVATYLNRSVQDGPLGHDSVEDARACMELILWKAARDQELRERLRVGSRLMQPPR